MRGRAPFLAATALLALVLGCQSTPPPPSGVVAPTGAPNPTASGPVGPTTPAGPIPTEPSSTPDEAGCRQTLTALNLRDPLTIAAVAACRFNPAGESAARQVLAAGGSRDQLWAAVWVYATTGSDAAPLLPYASNADPSIAAMAAAALTPLGERAGVDGLTASLAQTGLLAGSEPPEQIDEFAVFSLSRSVVAVGSPASPSATPSASPTDPVAAWQQWLAQNGAKLVFDPAARQWKLP